MNKMRKKMPVLAMMAALAAADAQAGAVNPEQEEWLWKDLPIIEKQEHSESQAMVPATPAHYGGGHSDGSSAVLWYMLGNMNSSRSYADGYSPGLTSRSQTQKSNVSNFRNNGDYFKKDSKPAPKTVSKPRPSTYKTAKSGYFGSKSSGYGRSGGFGSSGARGFSSFGG